MMMHQSGDQPARSRPSGHFPEHGGASAARGLRLRDLGLVDYVATWRAMQDFVARRTEETVDEVWLLQHPPVFTLGQAARSEHLIAPGDIAVIQSDRGGQVTYHGPGQLIMYLLLDLRRLNLGPKALVDIIEAALIRTLAAKGVDAGTLAGARGVYVAGRKIASLGLRIRQGCSFHGLALNVDMDLEPFSRIDPCGLRGMQVTQLSDLVPVTQLSDLPLRLAAELAQRLSLELLPESLSGTLAWRRIDPVSTAAAASACAESGDSPAAAVNNTPGGGA